MLKKCKRTIRDIIKIGPKPQPSIGGKKSPSEGIASKNTKNRLRDRLT